MDPARRPASRGRSGGPAPRRSPTRRAASHASRRLHALGDDLEPEPVAEVDDECGWRRRVRPGQAHDEPAVDLEHVDLQLLEVRERRSGPRRSRPAPCATPTRRSPASTSIVRSMSAITTSSDTSSWQPSAGKPWSCSIRSTSLGRPRSSRSAGPRLTATAISKPAAAALADLRQRPVEHERRQRAGQPALLHQRQEVARAEQAAHGMLPAHQRLDAAHGAACAGPPWAGSAAPARPPPARRAARR